MGQTQCCGTSDTQAINQKKNQIVNRQALESIEEMSKQSSITISQKKKTKQLLQPPNSKKDLIQNFYGVKEISQTKTMNHDFDLPGIPQGGMMFVNSKKQNNHYSDKIQQQFDEGTCNSSMSKSLNGLTTSKLIGREAKSLFKNIQNEIVDQV